jgi:acyl-coenzyme A synthetase/AMP-(fatty) acid ligase
MLSSIEATSNATTLIVDRHITANAGDQLALRYGEKRYSYNDLAALMNRAGNMMRRFGAGPGDEILVAVSPSPSLVASVLGAMKIGAAAVLLPKGADNSDVSSILSATHPKLAIADAARASIFAEWDGVPLLVVGEAQPPHRSFLAEMRESASSLGRTAIERNAPAVAVAHGSELRWLKHEDIAARAQSGIALTFENWNLAEALSRFAGAEEVRIP